MPGGLLSAVDAGIQEPNAYDAKFSKWLPVPLASVWPDGSRYASGAGNLYPPIDGNLHVVHVATGTDTVIHHSAGFTYRVVLFSTEGIRLTAAVPEGYSRGLWLEDRTGGAPRLLSQTMLAPAVRGGTHGGLDFNKADPARSPAASKPR